MTIAVCFSCGHEKSSAFIPCPSCGATPATEDELVLSLGLTDHFNPAAQVRRFGNLIAAGTSLRLDPEMDAKLREDVREGGLVAELRGESEARGEHQATEASHAECVGFKTARVFISSTFSDMHAERDYLVRVVFPKIRLWCESRSIDFRDIDLRWGVTREEAENGRALDICLSEIDGSRPFFLCLLGERYGWVPPALQSDEFLVGETHRNRSMTHLEVLHAVSAPIASHDGSTRSVSTQAFFYLREPGCIPEVPRGDASTPSECASHLSAFFEANPERVHLLRALKDEISTHFRGEDRVRSYLGEWNPEARDVDGGAGRLEGLSAFGSQVETDLKRAIQEEFGEHIERSLAATPRERDIASHRAFAQRLLRSYVQRGDVQQQLHTSLDECDAPIVLVTGPRGSGKSSTLAWLARDIAADSLTASRFIGAGAGDSAMPKLWSGIFEELFTFCRDGDQQAPTEWPTDLENLRGQWSELWRIVPANTPVTIIMDGIDRLPPEEILSLLGLLKMPRPLSIRIIVGGRLQPAEESDEWVMQLRALATSEAVVADLTDDQSLELIRGFPSVFCKTLDSQQVALLRQNLATRNPLFLSIALEEIRVHGSFETLEQRIIDLPRLTPAPNHEQSSVAGNIEACLTLLYGQVLARVSEDLPESERDVAKAVFGFLSCSKDGLTERELEDLAAAKKETPRIAGEWTQVILRQMRDHLQRRRSSGEVVISYVNPLLEKAATRRFVPSEEHERELHVLLADYHGRQPLSPAHPKPYETRYCGNQLDDHVDNFEIRLYDAHSIESWLWQLETLNDWNGILNAVSTLEIFQALWETGQRQAANWWVRVEATTGTTMVEGFAPVIANPDAYSMRILWAIGRLLSENGHPQEAIGIQQTLVARTSGISPGDILAMSNLADTLGRSGDVERATQLLEQECENQRSKGRDFMLPPMLLRIGSSLLRHGEPEQALRYLRKASLHARQNKVFHDLVGPILVERALAHARLGENDASLRLASQGVAAYRREGDALGLAHALDVLGVLQRLVDQTEEAATASEEARSIRASLGLREEPA